MLGAMLFCSTLPTHKTANQFPVNLLAMNVDVLNNGIKRRHTRLFISERSGCPADNFSLSKARDRAHILAGLMVALASIDAIIELIKKRLTPSPPATLCDALACS